MKKIFTLSMAVVLALGASAKVKPNAMVAQRSMPAISTEAKVKAKPVRMENALLSTPKKATVSGLKRAGLKAEEGAGPLYEKPLGSFYQSLSADGRWFGSSLFLFAPAYTNLAFTAIAPEGFEWTYVDPENPDDGTNENFLTSTDATLNLNYGNIIATPPALKAPVRAYDGSDSIYMAADYYLVQGGPASYTNSAGRKFLASNGHDGWDGAYTTGNGVNSAPNNSMFKNALGVDTAYCRGIAEYLPYTGVPYMLNAVYTEMYFDTMSGEATLTVYKAVANEDGTFMQATDEVLSTATASFTVGDTGWADLAFEDLQYMDPETGSEETLMIDCPAIVCITFDGDYLVGPSFGLHPDEFTIDNHALQYVEYELNGETYFDFFDTNYKWGSGEYSSEWDFLYDINFYYLHNNEDTDTFNAPAEGGEKTFNMDSYYSSGSWDITTPEFDDLPDWITVEAEDELTYDESGNPTGYTGVTNVKVTVAALPEGVESRTQDILLSYEGAQCTLHVVQPEGAGPEPQPVPGDVNGDGEVTGSDVTALYNHILFGQDTEIFNGDQNGDGEVTGSDVTAVYNIILGL